MITMFMYNVRSAIIAMNRRKSKKIESFYYFHGFSLLRHLFVITLWENLLLLSYGIYLLLLSYGIYLLLLSYGIYLLLLFSEKGGGARRTFARSP